MPLGSTVNTRYEDVAQPFWLLGADGNPIGVIGNPVQITGTVALATGDDVAFETDDLSGALTTIDLHHHRIHQGKDFITSYKTPDASPLSDNGTVSFGIVTGTRRSHLLAKFAMGGDMEGEMYEGTTWTGGVSWPIYNKRRDSTNNTTLAVWRDVVVSALGALLENVFIPGGSGPRATGGAGSQDLEWVLKPGTQYMIRITNRAGNNQPASLVLEWYEED